MMVEMLVQTMIQAMYEGGIAAFDRKFATFITRDNKLIVAPFKSGSELDSEIKEKFEEAMKALNVKILTASKTNFSEFENMQEAQEVFKSEMSGMQKAFEGRIYISANQALMDVIATDMKMSSIDGEKLKENLQKLTGVVNIRIEYKDETYFQVSSESNPSSCSSSKKEPSSAIVTGRPDRNIVINDDDQMDLKIVLSQPMDVDDFIAML